MVRAEEADDVAAALGGEMIGPLAIGGTSVRAKGVTVDLVAPDRPWVEDALATARQSPYGKVVSKPFLVLMKLCAMRGEQDDTDVIYVLKKMTPRERRETRALVSRHLPSERDDFDLMVRLAAG